MRNLLQMSMSYVLIAFALSMPFADDAGSA